MKAAVSGAFTGISREISRFELKGSREGAYTLSVVDITNGVPDDFEAGTGTSGAVAVGGSATGIESRGDRDWFAVTLETVRNYRIDLKGYDTGAHPEATVPTGDLRRGRQLHRPHDEQQRRYGLE